MIAVGYKNMSIHPSILTTNGTVTLMIAMTCLVCKEMVCNYSVTDLDELRAEYSVHITTVRHRKAK